MCGRHVYVPNTVIRAEGNDDEEVDRRGSVFVVPNHVLLLAK